jgi:hypothetical protein
MSLLDRKHVEKGDIVLTRKLKPSFKPGLKLQGFDGTVYEVQPNGSWKKIGRNPV